MDCPGLQVASSCLSALQGRIPLELPLRFPARLDPSVPQHPCFPSIHHLFSTFSPSICFCRDKTGVTNGATPPRRVENHVRDCGSIKVHRWAHHLETTSTHAILATHHSNARIAPHPLANFRHHTLSHTHSLPDRLPCTYLAPSSGISTGPTSFSIFPLCSFVLHIHLSTTNHSLGAVIRYELHPPLSVYRRQTFPGTNKSCQSYTSARTTT
ncbi:hypothetical protein QBC45DRAFT_112349 [Copromyces sp. CBS 386.78]|nr:hypothetical protein QBC45DRAFT_112349 [Copromyces sp. CBS 386.78]